MEVIKEQQLLQSPRRWHEVKAQIWDSVEEQDTNQFPFLQGDIIKTKLAVGPLGGRESHHDLWLVMSPDCDVVRHPFVRIAKVFTVRDEDPKDNVNRQRYSLAMKFGHNEFPLPIVKPAIRGYVADLGVPYFLERENCNMAISIHSLTLNAWHILNAVVHHRETRADVEEGSKLRSVVVDPI